MKGPLNQTKTLDFSSTNPVKATGDECGILTVNPSFSPKRVGRAI